MAAIETALGCMRCSHCWGSYLTPTYEIDGDTNAVSADVAGGTYFFTVNLAERKRTLLVDYVDMLRSVMREVKAKHPFHIDAMVMLPDHLHAVWTLPVGDADYPTRWMLIKAGFSRNIPKGEPPSTSRVPRANGGSGKAALGTPYSERRGLRTARRLRAVQSRQTRLCFPGLGLAAFEHPSVYRDGVVDQNWGNGDRVSEPEEMGERV